MRYKPSRMELFISNLLQEKGLKKLEDFTITNLAENFGVKVWFGDLDAATMIGKEGTLIFVNINEPPTIQYIKFLHELSHIIQYHLPYSLVNRHQWKYYETKANYIVRYLAMPYFLLTQLRNDVTVSELAELFSVPFEIAQKRLVEITNRQNLQFV